MTEGSSAYRRAIVFVAVSVGLHLVLLGTLQGVSLWGGAAPGRTETVEFLPVEEWKEKAVPAETCVRKPPEVKRAAADIVRKPMEAPAPTRLTEKAVVSREAADSGDADAIVAPVGRDAGGTGFTDSKGTSLDNREITSGEAPKEVKKEPPPEPVKPAVDVKAVWAEYARRVRERVMARREYPMSARRRECEGVVVLEFVVRKNGSVDGLRVAQTSGYDDLDTAAGAAVRAAAPLPPLPDELGRDTAPVRMPVVFKLDQ